MSCSLVLAGNAGLAVYHFLAIFFVLFMFWFLRYFMAAQIELEVNKVDPDVFKRSPHLLFQLRQHSFRALLSQGKLTEAITLSRCKLSPLTQQHPELLPELKVTPPST